MTTQSGGTDSNFLEKSIRRIARPPAQSRKLAQKRSVEARAKAPTASTSKIKRIAAKRIVRGHALRSGVAGAATGVTGAIPGPGTVAAATAGAATDFVLYMKVTVDMCQALVHLYRPDLDDATAFSYAVQLACYGTMERKGVKWVGGGASRLASDAGVRILRQQLRGSALIATKQALKRVGIVFTRKAVEKAIPFGVGAVIGASVNAGLATYVGNQARKHLEIDPQN